MNMTVLNQHAGFKRKTVIPCSNSYFHLPFGELGGGGGGEHIVIFYVVTSLHVYGERKGLLPGHKLAKPGHYLENSLICMIFNPLFWLYGLPLISYSVTVWFPLKRNSPVILYAEQSC